MWMADGSEVFNLFDKEGSIIVVWVTVFVSIFNGLYEVVIVMIVVVSVRLDPGLAG